MAFDRNKVIGKDGRLPWHLPDDMAHVRELTTGKPLIMGRRTYDSIGRPLPKRTNIVMTRDMTFRPDGVKVARSKEDALALAGDAPEIIVFGGAEIFKQFMLEVDRIYLTQVNADVGGDTYFDFGTTEWRVLDNVEHPADARHPYSFNFVTLERVRT